MTLKTCTCGQVATTKNATFLGRDPDTNSMLYFNCSRCKSTFIILRQKAKRRSKDVERLINIKLSIIENAPDVLWLRNSMNTTVCEELDLILASMGVGEYELQSHYDQNGKAK